MKTLFRNIAADGAVTFHPTESLAKSEARTALLRGAAPFRSIAESVRIPAGSRKDLAAFLNGLISGR